MLSCFNLCKCPSEWRWRRRRAQCDSLHLASDPSDQSRRRPSKASAFKKLWAWGPYQCSIHPLFSICAASLEGRLAEERPFVLLQTDCGCLSCCQCLCVVSQGVAWRTCFGFSALPLSLKHVTRAELLKQDFCSGPRHVSENPSTAQWCKTWGLGTMTAETLLKLQVSRG